MSLDRFLYYVRRDARLATDERIRASARDSAGGCRSPRCSDQPHPA